MTALEHSAVIVGSGAAGHSCARTLRSEGFTGPIQLVNGEGHAAINRTLVDKGVLPGLLTVQQIALPPLSDVEVIDARAVRLDASQRSVALDDGRELRADALVLACGSAPRPLDDTVVVDAGVRLHAMHSSRDAEELRRALPEPAAASLIVLGAGFIGAEVASHFAAAGARVTLVGRSPLPLRHVLGTAIAARLAALHAERVDARLGTGIRRIRARSAAAHADGVAVELEDGTVIEGDAVLVAVGSRPAAEWAGFAGGIPVDDRLRARIGAGLYAAGSAAQLPEGRERADHWDAAGTQGSHVARTVLHDLGMGDDPGAWAATTGFTLMAHGAVVAARGVRAPGAREAVTELDGGGLLTEFSTDSGVLTGVAGWNAGPHLARAAARI